MADCFPRGKKTPNQSPLFWVTHKDRYLRQLLIRDIEEETKRTLIVYFTDCDNTNAQIDPSDDIYLTELVKDKPHEGVDLLLETNGGFTDATEKICALLRATCPDLRVIVPRKAKSNGTVIALCGSEIVLSTTSELGPIDPSIGGVPAEFVLNAPEGSFNPIEWQMAKTASQQTRKLAKDLLSSGMLKDWPNDKIDELIEKLASRNTYHSHGSVIDVGEAKSLGLKIKEMAFDDLLWQKIWLLRSMYAFDCPRNSYSKLFEGEKISTAVTLKQTSP